MIGPATAPIEQWWRRALVRSVHDGDTLTVTIDLAFDTWTVKPLRLFGINAPELKRVDGSGVAARDYVNAWLAEHELHGHTMVQYVSWDKYAPRFDGVLVCGQGHCLNDAMLEAGFATPLKA